MVTANSCRCAVRRRRQEVPSFDAQEVKRFTAGRQATAFFRLFSFISPIDALICLPVGHLFFSFAPEEEFLNELCSEPD